MSNGVLRISRWLDEHRRLRGFVSRPGVLLALAWLAVVLVCAIFGSWIAPHDPNAQNLLQANASPGSGHLLGTDDLGRDVLSRLIAGARTSMEVPFATVAMALVLALVIGLVAGYRGGRTDYLLMRFTDAGMAFPPLVLALAVVAVLGSQVLDVSVALALVFAPGFARFIRGQTLAIREESFIEASTSIGTPPVRIVATRILPNVMTGLVVQISIALGAALLAESALSFLGLGPPPPNASWGAMLREAYDTSLFTHPWAPVPAGLAITLTVLAFNTIGDGLRDAWSGAAAAKRVRRQKRQRGLTLVASDRRVEKPEEPSSALLQVRDLCIEFGSGDGAVRAVDGVSFEVREGRIVGLVGESGSGKTVSSLAVLRLLPSPPARIVGGSIRFAGRELLDADFASMRQIRGVDIAMVFQDPLASLDPSFTVGHQLVEAIRLHERVSKAAARDRAAQLLRSVHIPSAEERLAAYPHQLSGGMRQRTMIAMALCARPRLLIADEPTTSLDVTVQAQIVDLIHELRATEGLAVLFVTHDLPLIAEVSDEVAVMYAGQVVEQGLTTELFARPQHPYTSALLAATPGASPKGGVRSLMSGQVPRAGHVPEGCRFHPRCAFADPRCSTTVVAMETIDQQRACRCLRRTDLVLPGIRTMEQVAESTRGPEST